MSYAMMLQGVLGAVQAGQSQIKKAQAGKRPKYRTPNSQKQALTLAKLRATDKGMPGEDKMIDRINLAASNAANSAKEAGNVQESLAGISAEQMKALESVGVQSARHQDGDLDRLGRAYENNARYEDMEFQMNKFAPYAEKTQESKQLFGASMENLSGFLNGLDKVNANKIPAVALGSTASGGGVQSPVTDDKFAPVDLYNFSPDSNLKNPVSDFAETNENMQWLNFFKSGKRIM